MEMNIFGRSLQEIGYRSSGHEIVNRAMILYYMG